MFNTDDFFKENPIEPETIFEHIKPVISIDDLIGTSVHGLFTKSKIYCSFDWGTHSVLWKKELNKEIARLRKAAFSDEAQRVIQIRQIRDKIEEITSYVPCLVADDERSQWEDEKRAKRAKADEAESTHFWGLYKEQQAKVQTADEDGCNPSIPESIEIQPLVPLTDEEKRNYNKRAAWSWIEAIYILQGYKPAYQLSTEQVRSHFPDWVKYFTDSLLLGTIGKETNQAGKRIFIDSPANWQAFWQNIHKIPEPQAHPSANGQPDWSDWLYRNHLDLHELLLLSLEENPDDKNLPFFDSIGLNDNETYNNRRNEATAWIRAELLQARRVNDGGSIEYEQINVASFFSLAQSKGWDLAQEICDFLINHKSQVAEAVENYGSIKTKTRKKLKPLQRETNEGLLLIYEMLNLYKIQYLDELKAIRAWGKIVSGEFSSSLIKSISDTKKSITLNGGEKLEKQGFLEKYRNRFK